jgi:hypothetical protein
MFCVDIDPVSFQIPLRHGCERFEMIDPNGQPVIADQPMHDCRYYRSHSPNRDVNLANRRTFRYVADESILTVSASTSYVQASVTGVQKSFQGFKSVSMHVRCRDRRSIADCSECTIRQNWNKLLLIERTTSTCFRCSSGRTH